MHSLLSAQIVSTYSALQLMASAISQSLTCLLQIGVQKNKKIVKSQSHKIRIFEMLETVNVDIAAL